MYIIYTGNKIERVIRLRNPFGNGEWNGDKSDNSSKWTQKLKMEYNLVQKDDGDFHMSFDDFIKYFVNLGIARLKRGYVTTFCKVRKVENIKCQIIKVISEQKDSHSYLQLYQKNPRALLRDGTYQPTALCYLILLDEN